MNEKNDCFAYTRVSTAKQGEGVSLQAQKEAIQGFAERNGLNITKWFEEKETAAKSGRPIFSSMMKQLNQHKAGGVIIHKIDRSARNFSDWAKIGELSDNGINVHFAAESLDFRSRGGRLTADIQAVIAADYIRNLREEAMKGTRGRLKQGLYPLKAPLGYIDNGGGQVKTIDELRGPLVRELFERYASREHSVRSLSKFATQIGLRSRNEKPLGKTGIERILRNPFYMGLMEVRSTGTIYPGIHEPLITAALFQRVQDVKSGRYRKKQTKHNFTYRGLFRCQMCGGAMIPERQKGLVYYRCHNRECATTTLRETTAETNIFQHLKQLNIRSGLHEQYEALTEGRVHHMVKATNGEDLKLRISQIEGQLERLTDKLLSDLIDDELYRRKKKQLELQKAAFLENVDRCKDIDRKADNLRKFLELSKNLAGTYRLADDGEKRQIVNLVYSNLQVRDRNLYLEPRNWVSVACLGQSVPYGGQCEPTNRSGQQVPEAAIDTVFNDQSSCEIDHFVELMEQIHQRQTEFKIPSR